MKSILMGFLPDDGKPDKSRDNGRMKERAGARKLMRAHGPGSYEESPQAVRSRMKREGKWKGDFKATRG